MKKLLTITALSLLTLASCKNAYETLLQSNDVDAKYEAAFDYFNQGKFTKAAQLFESLAIVTNGTARDDTVQYYWGFSNYRAKDYYTAETNFQNFINHFPSSPFTESAEFLRIDCLFRETLRYELDQTPTYKCLTAINEYLMNYPRSQYRSVCLKMIDDLEERLDRKAYEAAYLYYKMEDYKAARVALKNVLKDDADNRYREDILFYTAMASYNYANLSIPSKKKERFLVFYDDYLNFIGEYPDSPKRQQIDNLYKKAKEKY